MPTHPVKAHVQKRVAQRLAPLRALAAESKARRETQKLNEFYDFLDTLDDQDDQDGYNWHSKLDANDGIGRLVDVTKPYADEVAAVWKASRDRVCSMRADHKVYHPPTPPIPSSKGSMDSRRNSIVAGSRGPTVARSDSGYFSQSSAAAPAPVTTVRNDVRRPPRGTQRPRPQSRSASSHSSALFMSSRPVSRSGSFARVTGTERWDSDQKRMSKVLADDNEQARLEAWAKSVERDIRRRGLKG